MTSSRPMTIWLLEHGGLDTAIAGDLLEERAQGRSTIWYWKQLLMAVGIGSWRTIRQHKVLALRALATGCAMEWALAFAWDHWVPDITPFTIAQWTLHANPRWLGYRQNTSRTTGADGIAVPALFRGVVLVRRCVLDHNLSEVLDSRTNIPRVHRNVHHDRLDDNYRHPPGGHPYAIQKGQNCSGGCKSGLTRFGWAIVSVSALSRRPRLPEGGRASTRRATRVVPQADWPDFCVRCRRPRLPSHAATKNIRKKASSWSAPGMIIIR